MSVTRNIMASALFSHALHWLPASEHLQSGARAHRREPHQTDHAGPPVQMAVESRQLFTSTWIPPRPSGDRTILLHLPDFGFLEKALAHRYQTTKLPRLPTSQARSPPKARSNGPAPPLLTYRTKTAT